jgi:hypothetical protein
MNIYAESQVKKAISSEISINFFFVYYDPRINNYLKKLDQQYGLYISNIIEGIYMLPNKQILTGF